MLAQIEDSLQLAKTACEENAVLGQELEGTKVRLEKVASTPAPTLDPKRVDSTLERLEALQLLSSEGREKLASALIGDPNAALQLVDRIATLSAQTPSRGEGIPKTASAATGSDPDGWGDVIANGAA